jgi:Dyp-type peroxidase family
MTIRLNYADLQGNITRGYAAQGYAKARYFCLHVGDAVAGRQFLRDIRQYVTTADQWERGSVRHKDKVGYYVERPQSTLNVAFTWPGLLALGVPARSQQRMPTEFIEGMGRRSMIVGDVGPSGVDHWDPVWARSVGDVFSPDRIHLLISIAALLYSDDPDKTTAVLDGRTAWLRALCRQHNGVRILPGHEPAALDFQDAAVRLVPDPGDPSRVKISGREHFGYVDGIGNPVFEGQFPEHIEKQKVLGRGKLMPDQTWKPIRPGEFIIGQPDESQELPPQAPPWEFTNNGCFLVFRKLHQNTKTFAAYIDDQAALYARVMGVPKAEAVQTLRAKMVGRWDNGVPMMAAPTYQDLQQFNADWAGKEDTAEYKRLMTDFIYRPDLDGTKCPVSAHIRRANTRDMLDPAITSPDPNAWNGSVLNRRRRMMRRGIAYGVFEAPGQENDSAEHGLIFKALCANIFRQFEFVQQQWVQYGLDFNVGNHTDPLIGNRDPHDRFVIATDPKDHKPPFICGHMPQFVDTRGGDYFFLPSMTAIDMLWMGTVDPT